LQCTADHLNLTTPGPGCESPRGWALDGRASFICATTTTYLLSAQPPSVLSLHFRCSALSAHCSAMEPYIRPSASVPSNDSKATGLITANVRKIYRARKHTPCDLMRIAAADDTTGDAPARRGCAPVQPPVRTTRFNQTASFSSSATFTAIVAVSNAPGTYRAGHEGPCTLACRRSALRRPQLTHTHDHARCSRQRCSPCPPYRASRSRRRSSPRRARRRSCSTRSSPPGARRRERNLATTRRRSLT
jgi:hypothetical protein